MSDFEFLLGKATQVVSEGYGGAKLCHVRGLPTNHAATVAADFTQWNFTFMRPKDYVTIGWSDGRFEPPQDHAGLWEGDEAIDPPLEKTLDTAISILRAGGYKEPISQLDVRKPLYPGVTEPAYVFALGNPVSRVIGVGAKTGELQTK
jgi:hypothetical protein